MVWSTFIIVLGVLNIIVIHKNTRVCVHSSYTDCKFFWIFFGVEEKKMDERQMKRLDSHSKPHISQKNNRHSKHRLEKERHREKNEDNWWTDCVTDLCSLKNTCKLL